MNLGKESETLEFKKSTGEIKEAMVSICSILNKHGVGTLYFGVKPNGDITGQDVSESSIRDVSRLVYERIKPQIYPVITEEVIEEKHLIKVEFSGDDKPYSAAGRYYLRTGDEDREVTPAELKQFFIASEYKEKWEKAQSEDSVKHISKKTVKAFYDSAVAAGRLSRGRYQSINLLRRFGLVTGEYLNNAGRVLFSDTHPVTLKAAIFATDVKLTFLDMQLFEDNVFSLMDHAERYILKNIRWKSEIIGTKRTEIPEVPVAVVREVLANGFAHAIYNSNTFHEICIYPGKITIYSPGTYASSYLPEEYIQKDTPSQVRNTLIARMLYLNKSIEQFGSGFRRIDSLCGDMGVKYSYDISDEGFLFTIYRIPFNSSVENGTVNGTVNGTLNKNEMAVYKVIARYPEYTREQIADATSKSVRTIQRILNSLTEKEIIVRNGSDKSGTWDIIKIIEE